jgi:WD40 repeat protein
MEVPSMNEPIEILAHDSHINHVLFTHDSQTLLSAGMDNLVKLWSVPDWQPAGQIAGHDKSVNVLSLSPEGDKLVTASSDKTIRVWSYPDGEHLETIKGQVLNARLSPDGRWLVSASDNRLTVHAFETLEPVWDLRTAKRRVLSIAFGPASGELVVAGFGDDILRYDPASGELLGKVPAHDRLVNGLAFAPDGAFAASTGYYDQQLKIWDAATWRLRSEEHLDGKGMFAVSVARDKDTVAVSLDHKLVLYSVQQAAPIVELALKPKGVYATHFSPDGRWLSLAAADKRIRVWDLQQLLAG